MHSVVYRSSTSAKTLGRLALLGLAILAVASCQTEPEKPQGRQTYTADLPAIPDTLMPQRGVIKAQSDTATATFTVLPASIKIDLDAPPAETVKVDLWRAGVKMYELDYVHDNSQRLVYTRSKREYALAVKLIRRIYPASDSLTFATEFARLLVDNDPLVLSLGFPAKSIEGVDTALVMRKAMEIVAAKQMPVSSVIPKDAPWALGLDSAAVHARIQELVREGKIEADTAKLFPPYPVRTKNGIALDAQLVAGGPAVGVTGAFEATYKIVNLSSRVLRDGQESGDFEIPTLAFSEYPKLLELSGKLNIRAKESAAAGLYILEITAQDDSLRKAVSTVEFQVVPAADKQGPKIEITSPVANTVLENSVDRIDVKAVVSDPSGVDSVWIDNRAASLIDGKWTVEGVSIPVTNLGYKVVVRARDSKGNESKADILVGRMAPLDPGAPVTSVVQPKETEFPFDSASVLVRWKIEDPRAEVTKVWIGGQEATKEEGFVWARRVNLPPTGTPTTITFLGINEKNDSTQKFVQLTRKTDAKGPEIEILSPIDGAGVGYEIQSIVVRAKVSDPSGLDSVKINGAKAEEASQEYLRSLNLEAGQTTEIWVEAWDKLSNASRTSIRVSRKGPSDSSAPRIALLAPNESGTVLPLNSTTTTLKWIVTDLFGIPDTGVKIAGRPADRSKDTFSLVVAVPAPGKELSYRIDAVNVKGIANFETVTLKRAADVDAPSVSRVDSGRTVAFEIDSALVSWRVSDNYKLGTVSIGDKEVVGNDGLFSIKIGLVFGDNPVKLLAKDSSGNPRTDSINVVRTWKDTTKPMIIREAGTETKNVGFDVGEISVGWKVTDNAAVTVKINGIKTEPNALGVYGATIVLVDAVTGVKIEATDAAGNPGADSITITKASDVTDPVVVRQTGTKDTTVPYAIAAYTVAWKVTDDGGIKTVEIGGKSPTKNGDIYSYSMALPKPGKHVVKIWALDAAGNDFVDSVTIVRAYHDSIAPVVTPADTATRTKTVPYATAKIALSWKVTDNDALYTVTIGGSVVQGASDVYSRAIDLAVGPNTVLVVAKDTAGNSDSVAVVITREPEPAKMSWVGGADILGAEDSVVKTSMRLIGVKGSTVRIQLVSSAKALVADSSFTVTTTNAELEIPLQFVPKVNASGKVGITLSAVCGAESTSVQFQFVVAARNDAPSFKLSKTSVDLNGNAVQSFSKWADEMSPGPSDESGQKLRFQVEQLDATELLVALPAIDSVGTLKVQAKPGISGVARFQIRLLDNGDSLAGNKNSSGWVAFQVAVNAPPTLTLPVRTYSFWQNSVQSPGSVVLADDETSVGNLVLAKASSNAQVLPADSVYISGTGASRKLTFRPVRDQAGLVTVYLTVKDSMGGSFTDSMLVQVNAMNRAPSFTLASASVVLQNYSRDSLLLKCVSAESTNDPQQYVKERRVDLIGAPQDTVLFAKATLDAEGTLHLPRRPNLRGWFTFRITIKDNGGTENGGVDSVSKDLKIFFSDTIIDPTDRNVYRYVVLGKRAWFAEDLRRAHPYGYSPERQSQFVGPNGNSYTWAMAMNLDSATCEGNVNCTGRLSWQQQGLCPTGWNIPDSVEWMQLLKWAAAGESDSIAVERLKSKQGWSVEYGYAGSVFTANGIDAWGMNLKPTYPTNTNILLGRYWAKTYRSESDPGLGHVFADVSSAEKWIGPGIWEGVDNKLTIWELDYSRYNYSEVFPIRCIKTIPPGQWE